MLIYEIEPGQKRNIGPEIIGYNVQKFEQLWEKAIAPNCSESIAACKNGGRFMYRGFNSNQPVVRGRSWDNRVAVDSDPELSRRFDDMLKKLGFKALRSNSIFVTSMFRTAKYFGTPYIVFPTNGFNYTYTSFMDLALSPESEGTLGNEWMTNNDPRVFYEEFHPRNKDLAVAINQGVEIYINGQYYALKYDMYGEYLSKKLGIGLPE
jgi:hypothetical protein